MKIRSILELQDYLDDELSWRKRELTTVRLEVDGAMREHLAVMLRRAALLLLYAHWEGFVKSAAIGYLLYVSRQNLRYQDLKTNFIAIACRSTIKSISATKQTYLQAQLVDFLLFNQGDHAQLPVQHVIDTESNLSSEVLRNLLFTIGLPYDPPWQTKELLIDGALLAKRNHIAHGEDDDVDMDEYRKLHEMVVELLEHLKITIQNHAATKLFRR